MATVSESNLQAYMFATLIFMSHNNGVRWENIGKSPQATPSSDTNPRSSDG